MVIEAWVWGSGSLAKSIIEGGLVTPVGVVDSNESSWGKDFCGIMVQSPRALLENDVPVVIASVFFREIFECAVSLGVDSGRLHAAFRDVVLSLDQTRELVEKQRGQDVWVQQFQDENLCSAIYYGDEHLQHLRSTACKAGAPGLALEFGVFQGRSLNILAESLNQRVYGFDAFSGLREAWTLFHSKGAFDLRGELPIVHANAELVVGYFEETLPDFLQSHPDPIRLMHCDADLFESTAFVLRHCVGRFQPGTVIVLDDFLHPMDYERCDYRAFETIRPWVEVEYLSWDRTGSVAMKVVDVKEPTCSP